MNLGKTGGGHIFAQEKHKDLRVFWMKNPTFSDFPQIHPVPSGDANEDCYKFDVPGVLHFQYVPPTIDVILYLVSVIFPSALLKLRDLYHSLFTPRSPLCTLFLTITQAPA